MTPTVTYDVQKLCIEQIVVPEGRRALDQSTVAGLAESIKRLGLQVPITIRNKDRHELVSGRHRLEAYRRLGERLIPVVVRDCDEDEARLWEISENLHRVALTALEQAEHVTEFVQLTRKLAQVEPVSGGRGKKGGERAASRELGIDRNQVQRAAKIAALAPAAKDAARELRLDDNQDALIAAAKEHSSDMQVRALKRRAAGSIGDECYSPREEIELVELVFDGEIDLDPASNPIAQETVRAKAYFTKEDDGLAKSWWGRVFCNPPYSRTLIAEFADKMIAEAANGNVTQAIFLTHSFCDTSWYHRLLRVASAICLAEGRVKFVSPEGDSAESRWGQTIFFFGSNVDRFAEVFCARGAVIDLRCGLMRAPALPVPANDNEAERLQEAA